MSINGGYNGRFGRHGNLIRNKAKQVWEIGNQVNVGFLKGLTITEKHTDGEYRLVSTAGKHYAFQPHMGIYAL